MDTVHGFFKDVYSDAGSAITFSIIEGIVLCSALRPGSSFPKLLQQGSLTFHNASLTFLFILICGGALKLVKCWHDENWKIKFSYWWSSWIWD